mgnify:CR=1 FL=1
MRNRKRHSIDKTKCVNTKKTIPFQFFITMKKNLFRKFLALFLTGTLLAGVGCKDYDDDIDKLNDRLDELTTGKIATLESQLGSLQTAVDNLKSADDALGKRIDELKSDYTIVIVTHNMQQAARISDKTAFFLLGELVECGPTSEIFSTPKDKRTEDYISGRFG